MQLYIIRHAQSMNNVQWLETGSSKWRDPDPVLSDAGEQQKDYLAKFLKSGSANLEPVARDPHNLVGFGITHLYCSLMVRAVETGWALSMALDVPLVAWLDLHETGGIISGDGEDEPYQGLPGKPRSYFEKTYPGVQFLDDFGEEGWWNRPFEETEERIARARRVYAQIMEKHAETDDHVALVTHGAFYNHLMQQMLGLEDRQLWIAIANTAITRWDFRQDFRDPEKTVSILDYTNRVDFLPPELVTP